MKNISTIALTILLTLGLMTGCSKEIDNKSFDENNNSKITVKEDLQNYIYNQMPEIYKLEGKVVKSFDSVTGENYVGDEIMKSEIKSTTINISKEICDKANQINVNTLEIRKLHDIYLEAITLRHNSFSLILDAIDKQDFKEVNIVNNNLETVKKYLEDYEKGLYKLAKENNIDLNNIQK